MVLLMSLLIRVLCESSDCMAGYSTLKVTFFFFIFVCLFGLQPYEYFDGWNLIKSNIITVDWFCLFQNCKIVDLPL